MSGSRRHISNINCFYAMLMSMTKLFKYLTIFCFVAGLVLFFSGDEAFFPKSGGTGLVLLIVGTPLFALLSSLTKSNKKLGFSLNNKTVGAGSLVLLSGLGIAIIGSATSKGFDAFGAIILGVPIIISGLIIIVIGIFKRS